jgi:L-alanine-DL-glutamate epimerase-like enolase superfamily enzyme
MIGRMRRRELLLTLPAAAFAKAGKMPITGIEIWRFDGTRQAETGINAQGQVNPLHVYDELRPKPYRDESPGTREAAVSSIYLRIAAGDAEGWYGPVDREAAIVIDNQLRTFLTGKDALAVETLWDQMHRLNRHSRRGHFMMAISAIDNALWDLRGRVFGAPVYRLLGGPSRAKAEAYGSCLGYSVEPERLGPRAKALKEAGFRHQKWFMPYGPGSGAEGLRKNVEMVRLLREAVGDDVSLMFDAFMGWELNYALDWAKQVERYRPRWIEEAFAPDKIQSFAALRRATSIPVASGEHFYGRWEVQDYLRADALNVVQADPEWCGGTSELVKIATICSAHDVNLIPHGHNIHAALHVVASQSPMTCPLVEFLILKMGSYYHFLKNPPVVESGFLALSEAPGFGFEFDEAKIQKRTLLKLSF